MGVPGLFSYLRKYNKKNDAFSTIKSKLPNPEEEVHLYLDFNGAIYQVIKPEIRTNEVFIIHILDYLDNLINIFTYDKISGEAYENNEINIDECGNNIKPIQKYKTQVSKLFIAIDGVPPRAKMEQQRQRRFHSVCRKKKTAKIDELYGNEFDKSSTNWHLDTNMITPGTEFMQELREAITNHLSTNELYRNIEVVFSDWSQPGEGEHKIIHHLVKYPTPENIKTVIYGLDGDLIMLSLSTRLNNLFLLREAYEYGQYAFEHEGFPYLYMDVDCFKIALIKECCSKLMKKPMELMTEEEIKRFIDDYIVLTMILGNDFMPKIQWISIKQDGHAVLLGAYFQIQNGISYEEDDNVRWLFNRETGEINLSLLRGIFSVLSRRENTLMIKFLEKRESSKIFIPKDATEREKQQILLDFLPLTQKSWLEAEQDIRPSLLDWRYRYYALCHRLNTKNNPDEIKKICNDYVKTLIWNARYYLCNCASWTWYYPYAYSPTLADVFHYLDGYKTLNHIKFDLGEPTTPQCVLMMVLPKNSSSNMPKSVYKMISEDELLDKIYFPQNYAINIPLHTRYYECTPRIPKIDIIKTEEIISKCKLTKDEENRNVIGSWKYYKYGELICSEFDYKII
jgi:5'-3' exonuclease